MLSTSDAISSVVRSDWQEPLVAPPAATPAAAPTFARKRALPPWIAFSLSSALHVLAAILLWHYAPRFVPQDDAPTLQVELRAGDNVAGERVPETPTEPPPLPQPKPRAAASHKSTANAAAATPPVIPAPASEPVPPPLATPRIAEPAAVPAARPSTESAADAASVRILAWLAQYRRYPPAARRARLEGVVEVVVVLLPDGRLVQQRVAQSSGHAVLDQAALELLRRASPVPASTFETGEAAQLELHLPIVYRLSI